MKTNKLFSFSYWRIIVPLGIVFAILSQLFSTVCGLGMTFDSKMYLEISKFVQNSGTILDFSHPDFYYKPPIFSIFLSFFSVESMRIINTVLLSITLFIIALIFDNILKSEQLKSIGFISVATFTPFIMVHVYLWTEPLFLLVLFSSVLLYLKYIFSQKNAALIWLALLSILMSLTRHVGIFILLGYFFALILNTSISKWKSILYLIVGSTGFVIWNLLVTIDGFSERVNTFSSPVLKMSFARLDNVFMFLRGASLWIVPNNFSVWLRISVLGFLLLILTYAIQRLFSKTSHPVLKGLIIIMSSYYILMHLPFRLLEFSEDRYLVPIYPFFVIIILMVIDYFKKESVIKFNIIVMILIVWLAYPSVRTIKNSIFWNQKICNEEKREAKFDSDNSIVKNNDDINPP